MTNPTAPLLSESEVEALDRSVERFLPSLTFGEPARGNRYVESADANTYFEQGVDNEYDAFDLLRQFPALIRDWRALKAQNELAEKVLKFILPNHPSASITEIAKPALAEVDALREQLAQAEKQRK